MKNPMTAQTEYLDESEERGVAASETVQRRNVRRRIGSQDSDVAAEDIDEPVHHERQDQQLEHVSHRGGPQAENRPSHQRVTPAAAGSGYQPGAVTHASLHRTGRYQPSSM
jgi:hypothetical protein